MHIYGSLRPFRLAGPRREAQASHAPAPVPGRAHKQAGTINLGVDSLSMLSQNRICFFSLYFFNGFLKRRIPGKNEEGTPRTSRSGLCDQSVRRALCPIMEEDRGLQEENFQHPPVSFHDSWRVGNIWGGQPKLPRNNLAKFLYKYISCSWLLLQNGYFLRIVHHGYFPATQYSACVNSIATNSRVSPLANGCGTSGEAFDKIMLLNSGCYKSVLPGLAPQLVGPKQVNIPEVKSPLTNLQRIRQ